MSRRDFNDTGISAEDRTYHSRQVLMDYQYMGVDVFAERRMFIHAICGVVDVLIPGSSKRVLTHASECIPKFIQALCDDGFFVGDECYPILGEPTECGQVFDSFAWLTPPGLDNSRRALGVMQLMSAVFLPHVRLVIQLPGWRQSPLYLRGGVWHREIQCATKGLVLQQPLLLDVGYEGSAILRYDHPFLGDVVRLGAMEVVLDSPGARDLLIPSECECCKFDYDLMARRRRSGVEYETRYNYHDPFLEMEVNNNHNRLLKDLQERARKICAPDSFTGARFRERVFLNIQPPGFDEIDLTNFNPPEFNQTIVYDPSTAGPSDSGVGGPCVDDVGDRGATVDEAGDEEEYKTPRPSMLPSLPEDDMDFGPG